MKFIQAENHSQKRKMFFQNWVSKINEFLKVNRRNVHISELQTENMK